MGVPCMMEAPPARSRTLVRTTTSGYVSEWNLKLCEKPGLVPLSQLFSDFKSEEDWIAVVVFPCFFVEVDCRLLLLLK